MNSKSANCCVTAVTTTRRKRTSEPVSAASSNTRESSKSVRSEWDSREAESDDAVLDREAGY